MRQCYMYIIPRVPQGSPQLFQASVKIKVNCDLFH